MENTLQHWGIPGMRWGRKKSSKLSSNKTTNKKSSLSEDHTAASRLKGKRLEEMSNAEIRTLTTRIQLEKQYRDLNPNKVDVGKKKVKTVMDNIEFAGKVVTSGVAVYAAGKKIFDYVSKPETQKFIKNAIAKANSVGNKG